MAGRTKKNVVAEPVKDTAVQENAAVVAENTVDNKIEKAEKIVKEKAAAVEKTVEKKAKEAEVAVKCAAKTVKKAEEKAVKTAKDAVKKAATEMNSTKQAAKKDAEVKVVVQHRGADFEVERLVEAAKAAWVEKGHRVSSIKTLEVYVNMDEKLFYPVINGEAQGGISIF